MSPAEQVAMVHRLRNVIEGAFEEHGVDSHGRRLAARIAAEAIVDDICARQAEAELRAGGGR